jgi:hypothetical protein
MTNAKRGLLVTLLDRSGSMLPLTDVTINGLHEVLRTQARLVKHGDMEDITAYIAQFDYTPYVVGEKTFPDPSNNHLYNYDWIIGQANSGKVNGYEVMVDMESLDWADLPDVSNFEPRGTTALYDAIGYTITTIGDKLSAMKEEERPGKILFVIITDGKDNSSVKFKAKEIGEMIKHQTEIYSWEFMFIGSDEAALSEAKATLNVKASNTIQYGANLAGTTEMYTNLSRSVAKSYCG